MGHMNDKNGSVEFESGETGIDDSAADETESAKLDDETRRVRFFSVNDLATGWYLNRVAELVEDFDPTHVPTSTTDVLELYNVLRYLENDLLPHTYTDAQRIRARARIPQLRSVIARYFAGVDDETCAAIVGDVDHLYHADLLELLGRNKAFTRTDRSVMLPALRRIGVHLTTLLASKQLVTAYDHGIRDELRASPRNAEVLVRKYLARDVSEQIHLPPSFTLDDARELLASYIEDPGANPNYVALIETAPPQATAQLGIDDRLKLQAKRRHAELTARFFEHGTTLRTGCEVMISPAQDEPVRERIDESDGIVVKYTYSPTWLENTCDNASILNNFQHLFEFADPSVLLTLPSYPANFGFVDRFMTTTGRTVYQTGAAFQAIDTSTLLQTRMYQHYLGTKDIDLEAVIAWFFEEYLVDEFGAANFTFTPSDQGTSYLQKVRHLFAEMESVAAQFALFVRDGALDRDLLTISSNQVRYKDMPSMVTGKYLYPTDDADMVFILQALFSDQSLLTHINDQLQDETAARLLVKNKVAYTDFLDFQKPIIDRLIELDVLVNTGTRVRLARVEQFRILLSVFMCEASSYYHLSPGGRAEADDMVKRDWLTRHTTLLTDAEGKYFNYFLNNDGFTNGPKLRNKYLHGTQANADGEDTHFHTYMIALRMTIALVIKINDDFCLAAQLQLPADGRPADSPHA